MKLKENYYQEHNKRQTGRESKGTSVSVKTIDIFTLNCLELAYIFFGCFKDCFCFHPTACLDIDFILWVLNLNVNFITFS